VQHCFQGSPPPFKLIAQEVTQSPTATPEQIAKRISLNLLYHAPKQAKHHPRAQAGGGYGDYYDSQERETPSLGWSSRQKNPLRSLNRLEPDKAMTCPHGIPFYRTCAICDKKKFQEQTGLG
jgi:hypothetical protein